MSAIEKLIRFANGFEDSEVSAIAELAEVELAAKDAALAAARDALKIAQRASNSLLWWFDGYDESMILRCVGCDFEQSEAHHADCLVGKLEAALSALAAANGSEK